jgi:competence protein ComGC
MKKILQKIHSQSGESLIETLVAMLVVSLGVIMLVTMVNASKKMLEGSDEYNKIYQDSHNELVKRQVGSVEGTVSFQLNQGTDSDYESLSDSVDIFTSANDEDLFVYEVQEKAQQK